MRVNPTPCKSTTCQVAHCSPPSFTHQQTYEGDSTQPPPDYPFTSPGAVAEDSEGSSASLPTCPPPVLPFSGDFGQKGWGVLPLLLTCPPQGLPPQQPFLVEVCSLLDCQHTSSKAANALVHPPAYLHFSSPFGMGAMATVAQW